MSISPSLLRRVERLIVGGDQAFHKLLVGAGWLLAGNAFAAGLGFVRAIILARLLGVEQYGFLALIVTYGGTINQFVDSRVWEAAIKFI